MPTSSVNDDRRVKVERDGKKGKGWIAVYVAPGGDDYPAEPTLGVKTIPTRPWATLAGGPRVPAQRCSWTASRSDRWNSKEFHRQGQCSVPTEIHGRTVYEPFP